MAMPTHTVKRSTLARLRAEYSEHWGMRAQHLEAALRHIAAGDGYYGAQAREYKEIACDALAGKPFFALPPSCRDCGTDYGWIGNRWQARCSC
jgi:hypothetical protein